MPPSGSSDLENCPVPDDTLKRLLEATVGAVTEIGATLSETQRAELAVYCYRRAHFRDLGLTLAAHCSRQSLISEAGHAGELIYTLAKAGPNNTNMGTNRPRGEKAPVSLHVV